MYDKSSAPIDYEIVDVNDALLSYAGLAREEVIGRSASTLCGQRKLALPPLDFITKTVASGEPRISELFLESSNGRLSIAACRLSPGEFNAIFEDITGRKLASEKLEAVVDERTRQLRTANQQLAARTAEKDKIETQLRNYQVHFRSLYEKLPIGYQSLDAEGFILEVNPAWLNALGYEQDEVIGHRFCDFLIPEQVPLFVERFPLFKKRGEIQTEFTMHRKNGTHALISLTGRIDYDSEGAFTKSHCFLLDITEQRRNEAEKNRSASLPPVNPNPVMQLSPQGKIIFANNASLPILQYWNTSVGGTLPDYWKSQINEIFSRGNMEDYEIECGGRFFDLKIFPNPELGVLNLYALEVTNKKQIARELAISEANYRMIFDNASDAMILWEIQDDGVYRVREANLTALERYGYTKEEMLKLNGSDLNTPESFSRTLAAGEQMNKTGYAVYELTHKTKAGRFIPSEVYGHTFELEGKRVVMSVIRDISERKRVEAERARYQAELEVKVEERTAALSAEIASRQKAEEALQSLYERERSLSQALKRQIDERIFFTRALVHELKTPLTPLLGSSEIMAKLAQEEPLIGLSRNIRSGALQLQQRIDQMLDLAKSEVGLLKLKLRPVDLVELIKDVAMYTTPVSEKKGLVFSINLPGALPRIQGEKEQLNRVLLNLLDNAFKYTPRGGQVSISARREKGKIIVEVTDTGIGISPEKLNRLFVPYSRVSDDDSEFAGLGLGLALCKTIINLHGGQIWIESPGRGTTVGFTLPVRAKALTTVKEALEQ
ncbi:PAS domain-containing sensor histidine kinase [Dehalogenimonas formicexedens]|nr:PAS domain S-box protein [Dehalogenimonas formicexedens]